MEGIKGGEVEKRRRNLRHIRYGSEGVADDRLRLSCIGQFAGAHSRACWYGLLHWTLVMMYDELVNAMLMCSKRRKGRRDGNVCNLDSLGLSFG